MKSNIHSYHLPATTVSRDLPLPCGAGVIALGLDAIPPGLEAKELGIEGAEGCWRALPCRRSGAAATVCCNARCCRRYSSITLDGMGSCTGKVNSRMVSAVTRVNCNSNEVSHDKIGAEVKLSHKQETLPATLREKGLKLPFLGNHLNRKIFCVEILY